MFRHALDDDNEYRLTNGDLEFVTNLEVASRFDVMPLHRILWLAIATDARLRVLKKRATHSHLSMRMRSLLMPLAFSAG